MSVIKSFTCMKKEFVSSSRTELHDCVCLAMVPFMARTLRSCSKKRETEHCPACDLDSSVAFAPSDDDNLHTALHPVTNNVNGA